MTDTCFGLRLWTPVITERAAGSAVPIAAAVTLSDKFFDRAGINPFDYLTELQRHAEELKDRGAGRHMMKPVWPD